MTETTNQTALAVRIQRYLKSSKTAPTRFGRDAVNDPRLIGDMLDGRKLGRRLRSRIAAHLTEIGA